MSTQSFKFKTEDETADHSWMCVGIVVARWNSKITDALLEGALTRLKELGVKEDNIDVRRVPGTVELTYGAAAMANSMAYDAVIMIGSVIRGGTPHFDYVCENATYGCAQINAKGRVPVIFCVLTTDDEQQALDRAGGALCNKGVEAADAAVDMAEFSLDMYQSDDYYDDDDDADSGFFDFMGDHSQMN